MKKLLLLIATLCSTACILAPATALAASSPLDQVCSKVPTTSARQATVCNTDANKTEITGSNGILIKVVKFMAIATGLASVIMVMVGGYSYVTSTGDSTRVNNAKNTILYALIGLTVSVAAPYILQYVLSFIKV